MSVAPICISRRCKETLPSLRELRLASSRQVSTLGAETKVRAKGQHQLVVLREAVRQAKPAARSGFLEQPVGMHPAHPVGVLAIRGVSVSSISPVHSTRRWRKPDSNFGSQLQRGQPYAELAPSCFGAILNLATSPAVERQTGLYFNGLHEAKVQAQAYNPNARRQFRGVKSGADRPFR